MTSDLEITSSPFAAVHMRAVVDGSVGAFERGWRPEQSGEASAGLGLEWSGDSPQIHRVTLDEEHALLLVPGQSCVQQLRREQGAWVGYDDERDSELGALGFVSRTRTCDPLVKSQRREYGGSIRERSGKI
jgi:hypothetical protein